MWQNIKTWVFLPCLVLIGLAGLLLPFSEIFAPISDSYKSEATLVKRLPDSFKLHGKHADLGFIVKLDGVHWVAYRGYCGSRWVPSGDTRCPKRTIDPPFRLGRFGHRHSSWHHSVIYDFATPSDLNEMLSAAGMHQPPPLPGYVVFVEALTQLFFLLLYYVPFLFVLTWLISACLPVQTDSEGIDHEIAMLKKNYEDRQGLSS